MSSDPDRPARRRFSGVALVAGGTLLLAVLALFLVASRPRISRVVRDAPSDSPAIVTTEFAELKRAPSARAEVVERLPRGARVRVVADRGRWLEVATAGKRGFLLEEMVETDSDRQARERRARKVFSFPAVFGLIAEETDVLLAPVPLAPRAGRLRKGEMIRIHAVDHDYYAFRAADGDLAFVRSGDVDLVPPDPRRPAILPETDRAPKDVKVSNLSPVETPEVPSETAEPGAEPLLRATAEEEPAALVSKVDPAYPEVARRAGVEGTVVLDATIDEKGEVTDVVVLRGLPLGVSEAAVEAVLHWVYRPARGKNGPIASHKTIRVVFRLGE